MGKGLIGFLFWILVSLGLLNLAGCTSFTDVIAGNSFPDREVYRIERNYTTESDILQMFGSPYVTTSMGNNYQRWSYYYQVQPDRSTWIGRNFGRSYRKKLEIIIKDGIVRRYRYKRE